MPTRTDICRLCDDYLTAVNGRDPDAIAALFDADATQQDPIGTRPNVGREAIREFFGRIRPEMTLRMARSGPVTVVGYRAAFQARVDVMTPERSYSMTTTDVVTVGANGLITELLAFPDAEARPDDSPAFMSGGAS